MSEATELTTVQVGDTNYTLRPFRGLKAVSLMTAIGGVMKTLPDLQNQITEAAIAHRDQNMMDIPRAAFELRYPEGAKNVSQEAWDAGNGAIRLPDPDAEFGFEQMLFSVLPQIMDEARDQVLNVLALVVIPDSKLQEADEQDNVTEALSEIRKQLLYQGTLEELAELALAAVTLVKGQFEGKVMELVGQARDMFSFQEDEEETEDSVPVAEVEIPPDHPLSQTPETSSATLSTSSEPPTDGPEEKSSAAAGMTSTDS